LVKTGSGLITLSGNNTFTGGTTVSNGTLRLNGTVASAVTVTGGVLQGTGIVNHDVTINGGVHAPGNSTGIMQVKNNYTLAGGTLQVEINGVTAGTAYDQVQVNSASSIVTLSGTLDIIAAPSLPAGSTFTIIDNKGSAAVSGTFQGLAQDAEFYEDGQWWRISYQGGTGNDVVLTRIAQTAWQSWRASHFGTAANDPAQAGETADPESDGIVNLLEYALGGDPLSVDVSRLPSVSVVNGRLALTFTRTLANTDVTMTVQATDSLDGSWTALASSVNGAAFAPLAGSVTESGSGATRTVEVRDAFLVSDPAHPKRFMRLRVTR
jgi:autotransporter-associated beta strand protein